MSSIKDTPQTVFVDGIGEFRFNSTYSLYEGNALWNGVSCCVSIEADGGKPEGRQLDTLKELFQRMETFDKQLRAEAAKQLTELANDWAEDDSVISEEDFARRISVFDIVVGTGAALTFYFTDDDMFAGHIVTVYTDLACRDVEASIAG